MNIYYDHKKYKTLVVYINILDYIFTRYLDTFIFFNNAHYLFFINIVMGSKTLLQLL